jgi:drug/metabolite transporter (DMT)-like permease
MGGMFSGIFALFFAQLAGSTIIPIGTKIGIQTLSPLFFVFGRFIIAVVCMVPLFIFNTRKSLSLQAYRQAFLLAVFLFCNVTLFTVAIAYTTAIMSQILYTATPIVVGLLGHYFFHNRLTKANIIGLCIALVGVAFLIMQSATKQAHMTFGTPFGNILILIAVLSFSGYLLYSGVLAKTHAFTSVQLTSLVFIFVAVLLFIVNVIGFIFFKESLGIITPLGISSMVLVGFGNACSYFLSLIGIKKTNAFTASLFLYLGPFLSGAAAIIFLHEKPTMPLFAGGLLILFGVFYATTYTSIKRVLQYNHGA